MSHKSLFAFALGGLLAAGIALAGEAQLPAGHPDISKMGAAPATQPALPAGHPAIGAMGGSMPAGQPQLPSGHPQLPSGHPQLPSGHPEVAGQAQPKGPAATVGTLTIRAVQGTKGGPPAKGGQITVDLFSRMSILRQLTGTLDDEGKIVFKDLPMKEAFQPVVQLKYGEATYEAVGPAMDGFNATQQLDIPIYELADKAPEWNVIMRHVMVRHVPEGLRVTEVISLDNPTDRTWLGEAGADGKRAVFSMPYPENVNQMQVSAGLTATAASRRIAYTAPLTPSITQARMNYIVPLKDGKASFTLEAPAAVKTMMVVIVDNGSQIKVDGLESLGIHEMGHGNIKTATFRGENLKPGARTTISVGK